MSARPAARVACDVTMTLFADRGVIPVQAIFRYDATDPFALHVLFRTGDATGGSYVEWTFARSLLAEGLRGSAGLGDVVVSTSLHAGGHVLSLALSAPSGTALFETDSEPILGFLADTYELVPSGSESSYLDLDSELRDLMWHTPHD